MKTIDEAAKEAWYEQSTGISDVEHNSIFKAGVEFAQRWMPVSEELPENYTTVLVKNEENSIRTCALFEDGRFYPDFQLKRNQITHWRPIEIK